MLYTFSPFFILHQTTKPSWATQLRTKSEHILVLPPPAPCRGKGECRGRKGFCKTLYSKKYNPNVTEVRRNNKVTEDSFTRTSQGTESAIGDTWSDLWFSKECCTLSVKQYQKTKAGVMFLGQSNLIICQFHFQNKPPRER